MHFTFHTTFIDFDKNCLTFCKTTFSTISNLRPFSEIEIYDGDLDIQTCIAKSIASTANDSGYINFAWLEKRFNKIRCNSQERVVRVPQQRASKTENTHSVNRSATFLSRDKCTTRHKLDNVFLTHVFNLPWILFLQGQLRQEPFQRPTASRQKRR